MRLQTIVNNNLRVVASSINLIKQFQNKQGGQNFITSSRVHRAWEGSDEGFGGILNANQGVFKALLLIKQDRKSWHSVYEFSVGIKTV